MVDRDRDDAPRRDGYAYRVGDPGPGPNPHRLRRSRHNRRIAGVCGGLADHFEWDATWLRIAWVLAALFFFPFPIFGYGLAALIMKPERSGPERAWSAEEERFWRTFSARPDSAYSELKHRFRALDSRIAQMESVVTSAEYGLRREFRKLDAQ